MTDKPSQYLHAFAHCTYYVDVFTPLGANKTYVGKTASLPLSTSLTPFLPLSTSLYLSLLSLSLSVRRPHN